MSAHPDHDDLFDFDPPIPSKTTPTPLDPLLKGVDAYFRRQLDDLAKLLEQTAAEERAHLRAEALKATFYWDHACRLDAARLGARLSRDPELVTIRLRETKHGAEWLLSRWNRLADVLKSGRPWSEKQRAHALDLTGIPDALRDPEYDLADPAALASREIEALTLMIRKSLIDQDEHARESSFQGNPLQPSRALLSVRRRHAALSRLFQNTHKLLTSLISPKPSDPAPSRPSKPRKPLPPVPKAEPEPEFDEDFDHKLAQTLSQIKAAVKFPAVDPTLNRRARRAAEAASRRQR